MIFPPTVATLILACVTLFSQGPSIPSTNFVVRDKLPHHGRTNVGGSGLAPTLTIAQSDVVYDDV